jgi:hypothetical protein
MDQFGIYIFEVLSKILKSPRVFITQENMLHAREQMLGNLKSSLSKFTIIPLEL